VCENERGHVGQRLIVEMPEMIDVRMERTRQHIERPRLLVKTLKDVPLRLQRVGGDIGRR
jgi:hypothetical protein